jgi:hypothetical protein
MRKKLLLLITAVIAFAITSCDDDDWSQDSYWIDMGTIQKVSASSSEFYILLDNGDKVWPAITNFPYYNPKDGQRIIANYTILSNRHDGYNHDVRLNDIYQVLTKPVATLTTANADSIGNDPLVVNDTWIASDHLNIEFSFLGNNKRHMVNLVKSDLFASTPELAKLQFRQNGYGDEKRYWLKGIVSFNIKSLQVDGALTRKIEFTSTNYNGEPKTVTLTYDWSGIIKIDDPITYNKKEYSPVN